MPARKNRQVEGKMLSEYLLKTYPKYPQLIAQPLGVVSDSLMAQVGYKAAIGYSRPSRPEVDAVVILPRYLILIEAKVWNIVNGLAKIPLYKSLVPSTPELKPYLDKEIIMELVVGWLDPNLETMARDMGVRVVVYNPPWLSEIVNGLHNYWTKEYREARDEKLKLREYFGVE